MILCLDSGNSRLKWGLHDGQAWQARGAFAQGAIDGLAEVLATVRPRQVIAANVAGEAVQARIDAWLASLGLAACWTSSTDHAAGVRNGYLVPGQLGVDRWCALIGARQRSTAASLVVMAGTATTIDSLDASGQFLGGLILPGLSLMRRSLARDTAALPLADGRHCAQPRCTVDAITSGCLEAQAGAIERAFRRLPGAACCLLSGGHAGELAPLLDLPVQTVDNLVLDGLARLARDKA